MMLKPMTREEADQAYDVLRASALAFLDRKRDASVELMMAQPNVFAASKAVLEFLCDKDGAMRLGMDANRISGRN